MRIRVILLLVVVLVSGCPGTEAVEGVCCVTDAQCAKIQLSEQRPCDVGQSCKDNLCVATECSTSAECADPNPVCSLGICIAGCQIDQDCAGVAGRPVCAADGMCVGCEDASQCSAETPICEPSNRSCRGCTADSDCGGGVCLEAEGTCVPDADTVFINNGSPDTGSCTRNAPCGTLGFALTNVSDVRRTIHILSATLDIDTSPVVNKSVYIDGAPGSTAIVTSGSSPPSFDLTGAVVVTVGNVDLGARSTRVRNAASVRFHSVSSTGVITTDGAVASFVASRLQAVRGTACTLTVRTSSFSGNPADTFAQLRVSNCQVTIERSRFESLSGALLVQGGQLQAENNLFIALDGFTDNADVLGTGGSIVRFNTFVNTTPTPEGGTALCFDASVTATSNVFAYRSARPLNGLRAVCTGHARFSLFDAAAEAVDVAGQGNVQADESLFFVDRANRDFRLGPTSPALRAAEPGIMNDEDIDGGARPQPAGSVPDMGAFEAP